MTRADSAYARRAARALLCGVTLAFAMGATAAPRDYVIDPVHTRLLLSVDHLGYSQALGTLSAPRGRLRFDPRDWRSAGVEVEIDLARIDFGDADWNERMLRRDFLDGARHPVARFVSTHVEPVDETHARVHGTLSLRGVALPVVLEARLNRHGRHPLTLRSMVGFSATAVLSRAALGMTAWKRVVGDEVVVRIEVEAQRARRGEEDDDDAVAQ
jgi:polyisoprenoid-binding protein YceI